ncbi:MAG: hypothetical protein N2712_04645 [Brevinematales bacterium]|nr:hypothetical protein [Brevinematales bacterium]
MGRSILSLIICLLVLNSTFGTNYIILSLDYSVLVDGKYRYLTSVRYNYDEYPRYLTSEVLTKTLKGVPARYQITSTVTSKYSLGNTTNVLEQEFSLEFGDREIFGFLTNNNREGFRLDMFMNADDTTYVISISTNYMNFFDIPLFMFFISDKDLSKLSDFLVLYNLSFTNISLKKHMQFDSASISKRNFVKFKKISGFNVIDRFSFDKITLGLFTNIFVEGRLVDARISVLSN